MPIITLEGGTLSREQKAELIKEYTATTSRVTGIAAQAIIVVIKENNPENIGSGGKVLADLLSQKA